jgi:hypothetical protein
MKISLKLKLLWIIIAIAIFAVVTIFVNHNLYPLKVGNYGTDIKTPDKNNLTIKEVTYRAIVKNKSNKPIDFKLNFNKNEKDREWYVYYDIIPDNYTSDICHLEPQELQIFEFKETINYVTTKTITSGYENMKIKYEIIKN